MEIGKPYLFGAEHEVFAARLSASRRYLEFGMGGSTLLAARMGLDAVVAVDSDPRWVAAVGANAEIGARVAAGAMSVLHGDIGPVRDWGNPADETQRHKWPNYISVAWREWARRGQLPDLVFVDGRFRVACCLSVFLAFGPDAAEPPLTMVHDFVEERPSYRDVFQFFELDHMEGSLALLRIRKDASRAAALAELLRRQFDFG